VGLRDLSHERDSDFELRPVDTFDLISGAQRARLDDREVGARASGTSKPRWERRAEGTRVV
jgi:hypothetical protein